MSDSAADWGPGGGREERVAPDEPASHADVSTPPGDEPSSASESPWAPAGEAAATGLFAGPTRRPRRRVELLDEPPAPPWSFGDDPVEEATGEATGATTDRDVAASDAVAADPTRATRRLGRWWIGLAVVALVVGLVGVRWLRGDGTTEVAGPRLPEAIDERWSTPLDGRFLVDAVVAPDAVVAFTATPTGGGELLGLDPADGSTRWSTPLDAAFVELRRVDDAVVVSATADFAARRWSFSVDPVDGAIGWERDDGVVLLPADGPVAVVDSGRRPPADSEFRLADLTTGDDVATPGLAGGFLVGLVADGDLLAIDDDGTVHRLDVSAAEPGAASVTTTAVATTSTDRSNVVGLDGRWFAGSDDGLVEVGFRRDARRVVVDRRPEGERGSVLPTIDADSFFLPVDDRRAVLLGDSGAMGIELRGDEIRVNWSAASALAAPRPLDGDRTGIEVRPDPVDDVGGEGSRLVDAATGELLIAFDGPTATRDPPVDGLLGWADVDGGVAVEPWAFTATAVAIGLDGRERWTIDDVHAGPFLGDRVAVVGVSDDGERIVFLDDGPRNRP